ncbi:MAG: hypothetical protein ACLPKB_23195 [Xanthobacteraceae bacterium]
MAEDTTVSKKDATGAEWVAWILAVGGGALVAFSLVWVLLKASNGELDTHLKLPLILVVSVIVLLIVVSLVTFTYSVLGLANPKKALGLPNGSVRAMIALMLLAVFAVVSIFLYDSLSENGKLMSITKVPADQLSELRSRLSVALVQSEAAPPRAAATGAAAPPTQGGAAPQAASSGETFTVYFRNTSPASEDLAKQLIVLLGTLVTAVSSFYFGSNAVASAHAAALDSGRPPEPPAGPKLLSISPNPINADGRPQTLTITGGGLGRISTLHLHKDDQQIPAVVGPAQVTDTKVTAQVTIPSTTATGTWDVVVDGGTKPTTIAQIEIK